MRFYNFINEENQTYEDILQILQKDCKKYLNEMKNTILYRGSTVKVENIAKKHAHLEDRTPMSTPKHIHDELNDAFNTIFGWKVRNGIFTTSNIDTTLAYGRSYMFFPIGDYKYCYSPQIHDLTFSLDMFIDKDRKEHLMQIYYNDKEAIKKHKSFEKYFKEYITFIDVEPDAETFIKKYYTDKNLVSTLKKLNESGRSREISFKCNEYYLINMVYSNDLMKSL